MHFYFTLKILDENIVNDKTVYYASDVSNSSRAVPTESVSSFPDLPTNNIPGTSDAHYQTPDTAKSTTKKTVIKVEKDSPTIDVSPDAQQNKKPKK